MPEQFAPEWEYWTPSDEMLELLDDREDRIDFSCVFDERLYKNDNSGLRYGNGNPDKCKTTQAQLKPWDFTDCLRDKRCKQCDTYFTPSESRRVYCSCACAGKAGSKLREVSQIQYRCIGCDKDFVSKTKNRVYCSPKCYNRKGAIPTLQLIKCAYCSNKFKPRKASRKCCSRVCQYALRKRETYERRTSHGDQSSSNRTL